MTSRLPRRKKVLLLAAGLSPQVVTETVYALAVSRRPRWIPDQVQVFTTREGAERARLSLLPAGRNWFGRLCQEYSLPPVRFAESDIHVLNDRHGRPLSDIRTSEDNQAAADGLSAAVRSLTADDSTELHVSIAGGRKTMGFFAGYALSLYGRSRDRLSHVLVDPVWENHPEFFYPTRDSRVIYSPPPASRPLDTSAARIELAEIPFVRLRELAVIAGLPPVASYRDAVHRIQERVSGLQILTLDFAARQLRAGTAPVSMAPAELAFAAMLMRRIIDRRGSLECPGEGPDPQLAADYLREYRRLEPTSTHRTERALAPGMDRAFFLQRRARYNAALRAALGPLAQPYCVQTTGRRPATRYALPLAVDRIRLIGEAQTP